jgi:predicted tellurium resistance membrane protein TerC
MDFFSEEIRITIQIILIDLVLSADNAVIIGMAASQLSLRYPLITQDRLK